MEERAESEDDLEELSVNLRNKIENTVEKMVELHGAVDEALEEIRLESIGADDEKREILKEFADALSESISGFDCIEGINPCLDGNEALKNDSESSEGHLNDLGEC